MRGARSTTMSSGEGRHQVGSVSTTTIAVKRWQKISVPTLPLHATKWNVGICVGIVRRIVWKISNSAEFWRKGWDSNPRGLSPRQFSRLVP
jgi:hypothetical protein